MRYTGLTKIGKKAFCVNFSLLETLKITTKEAILLQQIDFVNNKRDYLVLPMTILAKITSMSRGHLYRCLHKLKSLNLIAISEEGICVTDYYKQIKNIDFLQNHNKQHLISRCNNNFSLADVQNVACSDNKQNTRLTQPKRQITLKYNTKECNDENKNLQKCGVKNDKKHDINTKHKIQKDPHFFMTNMSQNDTKVSQNETHVYNINKDYNSISLCDNSHKEYIYSFDKENTKRIKLKNSLSFLLNELTNETVLPYLSREILATATHRFSNAVQEQAKIQFDCDTKRALTEAKLEYLRDFMQDINLKTLIFLSSQAKKSFIDDVKRLLDNKIDVIEAIKYSKTHNKLWICHKDSPKDTKSREFLANLYQDLLKELEKDEAKQIQTANEYISDNYHNLASDKGYNEETDNHKQDEIACIQAKYADKIQEFLHYRHAKGRFFNKYALQAFYKTLCEFERKKRNIPDIIDQSINRDYNWIFPITHKFNKRIKNMVSKCKNCQNDVYVAADSLIVSRDIAINAKHKEKTAIL